MGFTEKPFLFSFLVVVSFSRVAAFGFLCTRARAHSKLIYNKTIYSYQHKSDQIFERSQNMELVYLPLKNIHEKRRILFSAKDKNRFASLIEGARMGSSGECASEKNVFAYKVKRFCGRTRNDLCIPALGFSVPRQVTILIHQLHL